MVASSPFIAADASTERDAAMRRKLPVEIAKLKKRLHRQVGRAIADFASAYADQNERDYEHAVAAISGPDKNPPVPQPA